MRKFGIIIAAALLACTACPAQKSPTGLLVDGQVWKYSVSLGPVKAGNASLSMKSATVGTQKAYKLTLIMQTSKAADRIFHMNDTLVSTVSADMEPISFWKHSIEGDFEVIERASFRKDGNDYDVHMEKTRKSQTKTLDTSSNIPVYDMVSIIMETRNMNFKKLTPGKRLEYRIADYLTVKTEYLEYQGREKLRIDGKSIDCLVFTLIEPEVQGSRVKENELLRIYIADDAAHKPVGIDFNLKFGTAKARLMQ